MLFIQTFIPKHENTVIYYHTYTCYVNAIQFTKGHDTMKKIKIIFYLILSVAVFDQTLTMRNGKVPPRTLNGPLFYKGFRLTTTGTQKNNDPIKYTITADLDTSIQKCIYLYNMVRLHYKDRIIYYLCPQMNIIHIMDIFSEDYSLRKKSFIEYFQSKNNGHIKIHISKYGSGKKFGLEKQLAIMAKDRLEKNKNMKKIFIYYNRDYYYEELFTNVFCDYEKKFQKKESVAGPSHFTNNANQSSLHPNQRHYIEAEYYFVKNK